MITRRPSVVVIGLGKTGFSCARYLASTGTDFVVVDTRQHPPYEAELRSQIPDVEVHTGPLDEQLLCKAETLIVSPGMAVSNPAIAAAIRAGVEVSSDIDLFCGAVEAPVIAITGSNAKSTVTTLVGLMAEQAGKKVAVGGNLGTPVLDLLPQTSGEDDSPELYVLELSSFQLEVTHKLQAEVATILNISADHMDRYESDADYRQAKQRIFRGCRKVVVNLDEPDTQSLLPSDKPTIGFTLQQPEAGQFGVRVQSDTECLALGEKALMTLTDLKIRGRHNLRNALAALALVHSVGLPLAAMVTALQEFSGLPHRCQWVGCHHGVDYYNDSKATNVGAAVAALQGVGAAISGRVILIAGGDAKGASFDGLVPAANQCCRALILMGKDAEQIRSSVIDCGLAMPIEMVETMNQAVFEASNLAREGDAVMLAPACASFDMFKNFEARGDAFIAAVRALK